MTIAIGVLASDGVVIAADSEQTSGYAGGLKNSTSKISCSMGGSSTLSVSGAGRSGYLNSIKEVVINQVSPEGPSGIVQDSLSRVISKFFTDHVVPFSSFPDQERPSFELVIGRQWENQYSLWTTDLNTVSECWGFAAVGAGSTYASILLSQMCRGSLPLMKAAALAAYVVFKVKDMIEGCGRETQIECLRGGRFFEPFPGRYIYNLEEFFGSEQEFVEKTN